MGESQPQLRMTKEGDGYLRKMLVPGAHYILTEARAGYGPEALGQQTGGTRRQERQEARGGGCGAQVGGPIAPAVGNRGSLRTLAPQPGTTRRDEKRSGLMNLLLMQIAEFG